MRGFVVCVGVALAACGPSVPPEQRAAVARIAELSEAYAEAADAAAEKSILEQMRIASPEHPQIFASIFMKHWRSDRERVVERMAAVGDADGPGLSLGRAFVAAKLRRPDEAQAWTERSLAAYRKLRIHAGIATARNNLANIALQQRRWTDALEEAEAAHDLHTQLGDEKNARAVLQNVAKAWIGLAMERADGQASTAAMEATERAVEAAQRSDADRVLARALFTRARVELDLQRPQRALDDLRRAEALQREGSVEWIATRSKIGLALLRSGRFEEADGVLTEALHAAAAGGHEELAVRTRLDLAVLGRVSGRLEASIAHLDAVLTWAESTGWEPGRMAALQSLAVIYLQARNYPSASEYAERALELAERLADGKVAGRALNVVAASLAARGRFEEALDAYDRAIEQLDPVAPATAAMTRVNSARSLDRLGRLDEAARRVEDGIRGLRERGDPADEAFARNLAGELHRKRSAFDKALAEHERAIALALPIERWDRLAFAYWGRGETYRDMGRPDLAVADLRRAMDAVDRIRADLASAEIKAHLYYDKIKLYEDALDLSTEPGEAFEFMERSRARGLLDLWAESRAALRARLEPDVAERERRLLDDLSAAAVLLQSAEGREQREQAAREVRETERRLAAFQSELSRSLGDYAEVVYPEPIGIDTLQAALRPDERLLLYFVGEEGSWRLVAGRDDARPQRLPPGAEIEALAEAFLDAAGRSAVGGELRARETSAELGALLLPETMPDGVRRLIVVPDGPLHRIPFDALGHGERLLIEDHEVVTIPSGTALHWMRQRQVDRAAAGFLGVGAPTSATPDPRFPPLPAASAALRRIGKRFPAESRTLLAGAQASESALRGLDLGRYRYVHLATHGWLDAERPRHSGLVLARGESANTDGFLHLDEIFTLPLNAELVVLSACRSAVGELLRGEGFLSLNRAFLLAGADSVLATLWNVNDRSTAEFMTMFWEQMQRHPDAAAALRATKLAFLRSSRPAHRQFYRWAPFVLTGDPRTVSTEPDGPAGDTIHGDGDG